MAPGRQQPGRRVRVLFIIPPTGKFAGIERVTDEIADQLAVSHAGTLEIDVLHLGRYADHTIGDRSYRHLQADLSGRSDLIRTIRRFVAAEPYDLVVVPQVEATAISFLACLGLGRRFVMHLHGNPEREQSHPKARILFSVMRHAILHRLAAVFGTSPRQLAAFQRDFPSRVPHEWVPNPVRSFPDTESRTAQASAPIRFVNVGRFSRQKGQDILVRAFALLRSRRPDVALTLVGYGEDEAALRAQIEATGHGDAITIEHHRADPAAVLRRSDVYVSTSRWEGWSLTICEALRFGLPVVSTDCDFGPSDILVDQRLGRLVPSDDMPALVDAMSRYADDLLTEQAHAEYRRRYISRYDVATAVRSHADALLRAGGTGRYPTG